MAEYIERLKKNEYLKGWHDALTSALKESYSISTEDGTFRVIQEETITGLGLSKDCPIHEIEPIDVIERSKIDKAIVEIESGYSTCNQDWIDGITWALDILKEI